MKVRDIMTYGVDSVAPSDSVKDAAQKMKKDNVGIIPVFENGEPVGLITDRDITVRIIAEGKDPLTTTVSEAMTHQVLFCMENMDVEEAAHIMEYKKVRRLLVKDDERRVVGVLSIGDIATSMTNEFAGEVLKEVTGVAYPER
ncbi:MAG: CBS domain-containing protein [Fibrobacter sp.]|nr:CBS domain-containing protein [Fibrobacter sp.]